jgi:hypothetical protein
MHWDLWAQRIQSLTESQISGAISRDELRRCRLLRPANLQQEQSPFLVGKSSISMGHLYHSYHSSASVLVGISLFYQFRYPMRYRWWSMIYKDQPLLVGGFKHFLFFHILDIIIWTNIFRGVGQPPTSLLSSLIHQNVCFAVTPASWGEVCAHRWGLMELFQQIPALVDDFRLI